MKDRNSRGIAAVLTAASLVALLGFAALAVDASGFFQQASSQQRASDLACLAGVQELPESPLAAVNKAVEYLGPNHPALANVQSTTPMGSTPGTTIWQLEKHRVEIETPYAGSPTKMRVAILQEADTTFGRAIGFQSFDILEQAACEVGSALGGAADQPFGVLTGFTGGLINFEKNECVLDGETNSKCGGLAIPRHDNPPGSQFKVRTADNYIANMISGINLDLVPGSGVHCSTIDPVGPEPCDRVAVVSGDEPSKLYQGLISGYGKYSPISETGYLEKHHTIFCNGSDCYDGHEMSDVATCVGGCPTAAESNTWTSATSAPVITITEVKDCDCPRFTRIPVVYQFPTNSAKCPTKIDDPDDPDKEDLCSAEIRRFEWVFLLRPFFNGDDPPAGPDASLNDFDNSGTGKKVTTVAAVSIDFADSVTVGGDCFSEYKDGAPKAVRLVTP